MRKELFGKQKFFYFLKSLPFVAIAALISFLFSKWFGGFAPYSILFVSLICLVLNILLLCIGNYGSTFKKIIIIALFFTVIPICLAAAFVGVENEVSETNSMYNVLISTTLSGLAACFLVHIMFFDYGLDGIGHFAGAGLGLFFYALYSIAQAIGSSVVKVLAIVLNIILVIATLVFFFLNQKPYFSDMGRNKFGNWSFPSFKEIMSSIGDLFSDGFGALSEHIEKKKKEAAKKKEEKLAAALKAEEEHKKRIEEENEERKQRVANYTPEDNLKAVEYSASDATNRLYCDIGHQRFNVKYKVEVDDINSENPNFKVTFTVDLKHPSENGKSPVPSHMNIKNVAAREIRESMDIASAVFMKKLNKAGFYGHVDIEVMHY